MKSHESKADSSHRPSDLGSGEQDVAAWLGELDRPAPPGDLGSDLVGSWVPPVLRRVGVVRGTLAALALALVVTVGVVTVSRAARDSDRDAQAGRQVTPPPAHVVDDPGMPLYRDLETFRNLDLLGPDEGGLIADGEGR